MQGGLQEEMEVRCRIKRIKMAHVRSLGSVVDHVRGMIENLTSQIHFVLLINILSSFSKRCVLNGN